MLKNSSENTCLDDERRRAGKYFSKLVKKTLMEPQGRLLCEIDDLMRLYLSRRGDVLDIAAEDLVERAAEIRSDLKGRWNDDLGTGMELMESMILGFLSGAMRKYLSGEMTGKEGKRHDENCLLNGVI